jgi:hypothetical protein
MDSIQHLDHLHITMDQYGLGAPIAPNTEGMHGEEQHRSTVTVGSPALAVQPVQSVDHLHSHQAVSSQHDLPAAAPLQPSTIPRAVPSFVHDHIAHEPEPDVGIQPVPFVTNPTTTEPYGQADKISPRPAVTPPHQRPATSTIDPNVPSHESAPTALPTGPATHPVEQQQALKDEHPHVVGREIEKTKAEARELKGEKPVGTLVVGLEDDRLYAMMRRFDTVRS